MAGRVPDRHRQPDHQQREDDPGLAHLRRGDLQRPRQQMELVQADGPEQRAAAVSQLIARDMGRAAERDRRRQQRHVPGGDRKLGQVGPGEAGGQRRADADQVAEVAADVQRAQRGRVQQGEDQRGRREMPGRHDVGGHRPGLGELVQARPVGRRSEGDDPEQAVRAVPVPAGQLVHQPGEPLGEKAERPRDRRVRVVDVRQHPRPGGEDHSCGQVRHPDVEERGEARKGDRTAQRVIPAQHGR